MKAIDTLMQRRLATPIGEVTVTATQAGLVSVLFAEHRDAGAASDVPEAGVGTSPVLDQACAELAAYFAGERQVFTTPLVQRGTEFQRAVWDELVRIGYGERRSYSDVAAAIGRPRAVRAVGAANGLNPIAIIVPCHRVIGADGSLTGYAGGMKAKRWLLEHEAAARSPRLL